LRSAVVLPKTSGQGQVHAIEDARLAPLLEIGEDVIDPGEVVLVPLLELGRVDRRQRMEVRGGHGERGPSAGVDRLILALLCEAFEEEEVTDEKGQTETRTVLRFHPRIAPIKVGIFPLLKNKPDLVEKAIEVRDMLRPLMNVFYDDGGAIGRRYRRQDEAGTPFCLTIDFDTIGENGPENEGTVTLRHRDSMTQERVRIADLPALLLSKIS
jgi:hypothetical protein